MPSLCRLESETLKDFCCLDMVYVSKFHDLETWAPGKPSQKARLGERQLALLGTPEGIDGVPFFRERLVVMELNELQGQKFLESTVVFLCSNVPLTTKAPLSLVSPAMF